MMEMAKVTSKGQITIPISIRRRLGINEGDKILFVNKSDGVLMVNPDAVQGDLADFTADSVPVDAPVTAAPKAAKASGATRKTAASPDDETSKRKYIPPAEEPEEKPAAKAGGIDLSTLLDDIRSIGSNI